MLKIMGAVGDLIFHARNWVNAFLGLFFTYTNNGTTPQLTGVTVLGLFCLVLPLVGLGIGIIRRLVKIRA